MTSAMHLWFSSSDLDYLVHRLSTLTRMTCCASDCSWLPLGNAWWTHVPPTCILGSSLGAYHGCLIVLPADRWMLKRRICLLYGLMLALILGNGWVQPQPYSSFIRSVNFFGWGLFPSEMVLQILNCEIHFPLQLLNDDSEGIQFLRDNYRWYVVPNINPDGYVHTWTKVSTWKLLISMFQVLSGSSCIWDSWRLT